jgi:hypothetical protein
MLLVVVFVISTAIVAFNTIFFLYKSNLFSQLHFHKIYIGFRQEFDKRVRALSSRVDFAGVHEVARHRLLRMPRAMHMCIVCREPSISQRRLHARLRGAQLCRAVHGAAPHRVHWIPSARSVVLLRVKLSDKPYKDYWK